MTQEERTERIVEVNSIIKNIEKEVRWLESKFYFKKRIFKKEKLEYAYGLTSASHCEYNSEAFMLYENDKQLLIDARLKKIESYKLELEELLNGGAEE